VRNRRIVGGDSLACARITRREFPVECRVEESRVFMADTHSRAKPEARKTRWWFSSILFSLSSFSLVSFLLFIPARLTHGARYWINNALITFRGTTNVAAGSEFPNYTPWQITRIKFSRMREFAYRNDGIPRDVIHSRLFRSSECSLCGSRHTSGWDRKGGWKNLVLIIFKLCAYD
jgi:hypothetical protein